MKILSIADNKGTIKRPPLHEFFEQGGMFSEIEIEELTCSPEIIPKEENNGICQDNGIASLCWFVKDNGEAYWMPKEEWELWLPVLKSKPERIEVTYTPGTISPKEGYMTIDKLRGCSGYEVHLKGIMN